MPTPFPKVAPFNPVVPGLKQAEPTLGNITTPSGPVTQGMSAYGVDLTPPNPVKYSVPSNPGDIKSILSSVNTAQNDANQANNDRYKQLLAVLAQGNTTAKGDLTSGYRSALGDLSGSLDNNNTVFTNEQNRAISDSMKSSAHAINSGISRGLGNTTIMDSMQDQVQRSKNDALAQIAANKAAADNSVYKNISDIHQNQGTSTAGLDTQGSNSIANAIGNRNDVGPQIGDYASLIASAEAAKNSGNRSVITTTDPIPINSPLRTGGGAGGGGISASMGNYGTGSGGGTGGGGGTNSGTGAQYFGPGWGSNDNMDTGQGDYFSKLPGSTNTQAASPPPPSVPDQTASAAPAKPGGVGVYDGQNRLLGIKYPDGSFEPSKVA